jgi:hypothetical protein
VERMKRIENPNVRGVRTQGIVRAACIIHTFTVSFPAAESHPIGAAGFPVAGSFFFRSKCSAVSSGANSSRI